MPPLKPRLVNLQGIKLKLGLTPSARVRPAFGPNNGSQKHRGMFALRSFRRASQCRPATDLLFQSNGTYAQLVRCVAVNGGDNLGLISLVETSISVSSRKIDMGHLVSHPLELSRVSRSVRYASTAANQVSNKGFSDNGKTGIGGRGGWTG